MLANKRKRIAILVDMLSEATRVYENEGREIMPNLEYDRLYEELEALEAETGIVLAKSPTITVGFNVSSGLDKEEHEVPMLSLNKTKDRSELKEWMGDQKCLMSWKLDGITLVLTYEGGSLTKAVTRGNGRIGEVVTDNAKAFVNLPMRIPYRDKIVVRGESLISYSDFERINDNLEDGEDKYKNPRNLCSGSVRQLDSSITASRRVRFVAFSLVTDMYTSQVEQIRWLEAQGFEVVEHVIADGNNFGIHIDEFEKLIDNMDYPTDGLVLAMDDIPFGKSLGSTSKYPRNAMAFKWRDEQVNTILEEIEWSPSRTGLINPIAVFNPVEIEGTTVSRASVHNVSIMKELALGVGDEIRVYKANMIIPQIAENLTRSGNCKIPETCPVCDQRTTIRGSGGVETLHCENPRCPAKNIKSLVMASSGKGLDIEGMSEATIEKFVEKGILSEVADFFRLEKYEEVISTMEGFGKKSYENLLKSIKVARRTTPAKILYSLGIPGVGQTTGTLISDHCKGDWDRIRNIGRDELLEIEGIGDIIAGDFVRYMNSEDGKRILNDLLSVVEIDDWQEESGQLSGLTFVVTGSLNKFSSRGKLKELIQSLGAKVADGVSGNTDFLINNDSQSASAKNKKAKALNVPILTEDEVIERFRLKV